MSTRAIIEEILDDGYHVKVRIPIYHKLKGTASATPSEELPIAPICCEPGCSPALSVGDIVIVDFEDNQTSKPIVMGVLFRKDFDNNATNLQSSSLKVNINCSLPDDTTIGKVTKQNIAQLEGVRGNIQGQIDILEQRLKELERRLN